MTNSTMFKLPHLLGQHRMKEGNNMDATLRAKSIQMVTVIVGEKMGKNAVSNNDGAYYPQNKGKQTQSLCFALVLDRKGQCAQPAQKLKIQE